MKESVVKLLILLSVTFILLSILPVYAAAPSEPHSANAIWIEPSTITLTKVGDKFNITAYLNVTTLEPDASGIGGWQVILYYNTTYLNATRAGLTAGATSELFAGKWTFSNINISKLVAGLEDLGPAVSCYETRIGEDYVSVPVCASLCWIEFEVISLEPQPIQSLLNITVKKGDMWLTYFLDDRYIPGSGTVYRYPPLGNTQLYNSTVVPEFSSFLLAILMLLTLAVTLLYKKNARNF